MNKKEIVKQIEELIKDKENLIEGDDLDMVFEYDIEVLKNALKAIKEKPKGVWVATMGANHSDYKVVGMTKDEAINALVTKWNNSIECITMTREEIEDYYGINCEFIEYGNMNGGK